MKFIITDKIEGTYNNSNPFLIDDLLQIGDTRDVVAAKFVSLNASSYVITYDALGTKLPSNDSITLTAYASNHSAPTYYEFIVDGISKQNSLSNIYLLPTGEEPLKQMYRK